MCLVSFAARLVSAAAEREQNAPLAAARGSARCVFLAARERSRSGRPADGNRPAQGERHRTAPHSTVRHRTAHSPAPLTRRSSTCPALHISKNSLSTTLLAQVPTAKVGICAIYHAPGQPSWSACLPSSPLKVSRLCAQFQRKADN